MKTSEKNRLKIFRGKYFIYCVLGKMLQKVLKSFCNFNDRIFSKRNL